MVAHVAGNLTYGLKACRVAASAVVVDAFSVFVLEDGLNSYCSVADYGAAFAVCYLEKSWKVCYAVAGHEVVFVSVEVCDRLDGSMA